MFSVARNDPLAVFAWVYPKVLDLSELGDRAAQVNHPALLAGEWSYRPAHHLIVEGKRHRWARKNDGVECRVVKASCEHAHIAHHSHISALEPFQNIVTLPFRSAPSHHLAHRGQLGCKTLRILDEDGLVSRKVYPTVPPKVEYTLTESGKSLIPIIRQLTDWAQNNMKTIVQHRLQCFT